MKEKKSFKTNNPALQYISSVDYTEDTYVATEDHNTHITQDTNMSIKKQKNPRVGETKSRRLSLMLRPSLHASLDAIAYIQRLSVNELISRVMSEYAETRIADIEKYKKLVNDE